MTDNAGAIGLQRRTAWLSTVLLVIGLVLLGYVANWQLFPHEELERWNEDWPDANKAARGNILDANGHALVATNVEYLVSITPWLVEAKKKAQLVSDLAFILERNEEEIDQVLSQEKVENVILAKRAPASVGEAIEDLHSQAIRIDHSFQRNYPDVSLGASVLGFLNIENEAHYGLEVFYDKLLRGSDGEWYPIRGPWGSAILWNPEGYTPVADGADLVLTIDRNIQHAVEKILLAGIRANKASSGNIIVLDPTTSSVGCTRRSG